MNGEVIPGLYCGGESAGGFSQHGLARCLPGLHRGASSRRTGTSKLSSRASRVSAAPMQFTRCHRWQFGRQLTRRRSRELFVELFLNAHLAPPPQITLDLDATDDPLHGHQEERFFASGSRMLPCMVLSGVCMERRLCGWMLGLEV
jgi:hypothetical protein